MYLCRVFFVQTCRPAGWLFAALAQEGNGQKLHDVGVFVPAMLCEVDRGNIVGNGVYAGHGSVK